MEKIPNPDMQGADGIKNPEVEKNFPEPEEGRWETINELKSSLQKSWMTVAKEAEKYRQSNPEWFRENSGRAEISPQLVELIAKEAKRFDKAPENWHTSSYISDKLEKSSKIAIESLAERYRREHPEWFKTYFPVKGAACEHYAPELVEKIIQELTGREFAPEKWKTAHAVGEELAKRVPKIREYAEKYREAHPEWFKDYLNKNGYYLHYSPELVGKIREDCLRGQPPPTLWRNRREIALDLNVYWATVQSRIDQHLGSHPDWVAKHKDSKGNMRAYYSPELVQKIKEEIDREKKSKEVAEQTEKDEKKKEGPFAKPGWFTLSALIEKVGHAEKVKKITDSYRQSNPEWYEMQKKRHRERELFSPELVRIVERSLKHYDAPPPLWISKGSLAKLLNAGYPTIDKIAKAQPNYYLLAKKCQPPMGGAPGMYFAPELAETVSEEINKIEYAPEKWKTAKALSEVYGWEPKIKIFAEQFRGKHPEWFKLYRPNSGPACEHYAPELIEAIDKKYGWENSQRKLEDEIEKFSQDLSAERFSTSKEFLKLISVFGSARLFDILYKYRPEFRNISPDYLKGTLARYLGDFLVLKNQFKIDDVETALPYLSEQSFQDSLFEVVKDDCLAHYHAIKNNGERFTDSEIFSGYARHLRERTAQYHSQDLENVITKVEAYYASITGQTKPGRLVDRLESGRAFPDVNQKLNAKEIADKKKMLIADEMGMGKSASAILAKEQLGSKLAIVVVPNNVVSTWQGYLSDKIDEDGTPIGYFKPGMGPRVLTIGDLASTRDADFYRYDYILISQEKLNSRYVAELAKRDFDMLIVDEVHKVKNISEGTRAENLLKLVEEIGGNKHLVLLSGTPVPNKVEDIAMVLRLLYPERFAKINNRKLVASIIHGDIVDIRDLLAPRMQMKSLRESVEMPQLNEHIIGTELSEKEKDIYGILLDDDELTADEKIRAFRKYVMNPASVDPTPDLESSKIRDVSFELRAAFTMHSKIVMFVNGYIEGVIRGEENIIKKAELPADITVRIIDGHVPVAERQKIQEELGRAKGKMLLVVSGQTADVGVDFSSADYVCFYNEPWTEYNKRQQTSRVYRPGLSHDLMVVTSIANGTIEEGIHEYIQLKYQAIQKVLKGIPITEIEQEILRSAENQKTQDIEGDVMLAKEWLNSPQNRLHRFFGLTKEIGEQNFHKFLLEHGDEYADCYQGIGSLGFQSNTGRVVGSLIGKMVREKGQKTEEVSILDLASGPEILKKHIPDQFKSRVISLDLNPAHFKGRAGNRIVASFSKVPLGDKSVDYANLSLALHYTRLVPSRNEYERLKVLVEMNRILKKGGTGIINLLHSLEFKNEEKLEKTLKLLGFEIVREYSGSVSAGAHYRSNALVVEKFSDAPQNIEELVEKIGKDLDGLKLKERVSQLKNARKIVDRFEINGQSVPVIFNDSDNKIFKEEQDVLKEGRELKETYGSVRAIPKQEIISRGFLRIFNGKIYRLLKKSQVAGDFVDIR